MTSRNIDIMGISETHWTGQGKMQQTERETIIYSGRDDDNHKEGVGILMSRSASRTLMDWTPISERIIQARFYSQQTKLTIVHTSVTEEADEQVKEEFYVVLHDVLDNRNIKGLLIITGDINAKVGEELERHKFTICCGKDVCRIIIDRIRSGVDDRLRKEQEGYR